MVGFSLGKWYGLQFFTNSSLLLNLSLEYVHLLPNLFCKPCFKVRIIKKKCFYSPTKIQESHKRHFGCDASRFELWAHQFIGQFWLFAWIQCYAIHPLYTPTDPPLSTNNLVPSRDVHNYTCPKKWKSPSSKRRFHLFGSICMSPETTRLLVNMRGSQLLYTL